MTMNKALIFAVAVTSTAVAMPVDAQTYRWQDASGKTVISDKPPPTNSKELRAIGVRQPSVVVGQPESAAAPAASKPGEAEKAATPKAPDAPKTMAEKDADFRKRQQEAREKAEKEAQQAAHERDRREACLSAQRNLAVLDSEQAVTTYNEKGERQFLEGQQRQQERERTLRVMQQACK